MTHTDFVFPETPYLLGEAEQVLDKTSCTQPLKGVHCKIQEKVDGANINIFFEGHNAVFKHRAHKISLGDIDYKHLGDWYTAHENEVWTVCEGERYVLSGEWMFWQHTVPYNKLPTYFMVYDIFDGKEGKFLSQSQVQERLKGTSLFLNPVIFEGVVELTTLDKLLENPSQFGEAGVEGLYIRVDNNKHNDTRAKYVSPKFTEALKSKDHWIPSIKNKSTNPLESNWAY